MNADLQFALAIAVNASSGGITYGQARALTGHQPGDGNSRKGGRRKRDFDKQAGEQVKEALKPLERHGLIRRPAGAYVILPGPGLNEWVNKQQQDRSRGTEPNAQDDQEDFVARTPLAEPAPVDASEVERVAAIASAPQEAPASSFASASVSEPLPLPDRILSCLRGCPSEVLTVDQVAAQLYGRQASAHGDEIAAELERMAAESGAFSFDGWEVVLH